jgi:hypothetical protein
VSDKNKNICGTFSERWCPNRVSAQAIIQVAAKAPFIDFPISSDLPPQFGFANEFINCEPALSGFDPLQDVKTAHRRHLSFSEPAGFCGGINNKDLQCSLLSSGVHETDYGQQFSVTGRLLSF